jgi:hypothetical protein
VGPRKKSEQKTQRDKAGTKASRKKGAGSESSAASAAPANTASAGVGGGANVPMAANAAAGLEKSGVPDNEASPGAASGSVFQYAVLWLAFVANFAFSRAQPLTWLSKLLLQRVFAVLVWFAGILVGLLWSIVISVVRLHVKVIFLTNFFLSCVYSLIFSLFLSIVRR